MTGVQTCALPIWFPGSIDTHHVSLAPPHPIQHPPPHAPSNPASNPGGNPWIEVALGQIGPRGSRTASAGFQAPSTRIMSHLRHLTPSYSSTQSVNTGGAMAANKSVRAVRGPPNTPLPHAARVRAPTPEHSGACCVGLGHGQSVGCAPPRQPRKATCDLPAGASQQAMARASQGTAAAMRARISGPPSRIRRPRHGERGDEFGSGYL